MTQFQPGDKRINRKGRPKCPQSMQELAQEMRRILNEKVGPKYRRTKLEGLIRLCIQEAAKGNIRAIEFLFDRAYGKPVQQIDMPPGSIVAPLIVFGEDAKQWMTGSRPIDVDSEEVRAKDETVPKAVDGLLDDPAKRVQDQNPV